MNTNEMRQNSRILAAASGCARKGEGGYDMNTQTPETDERFGNPPTNEEAYDFASTLETRLRESEAGAAVMRGWILNRSQALYPTTHPVSDALSTNAGRELLDDIQVMRETIALQHSLMKSAEQRGDEKGKQERAELLAEVERLRAENGLPLYIEQKHSAGLERELTQLRVQLDFVTGERDNAIAFGEQLRKARRDANQCAQDNADWFVTLVHDAASELGCEPVPTSILDAAKQLRAVCDELAAEHCKRTGIDGAWDDCMIGYRNLPHVKAKAKI